MNDLFTRAVVDKNVDEEAWLAARRRGVTATEVAKLARGGAGYRNDLLKEKRSGERTFFGDQFTAWGLEREPVIGEKIHNEWGFILSDVLYHAPGNTRHLATPDGVYAKDGIVTIAEIKTGKHDLDPAGTYFSSTGYLDQMLWQAYVCDADEILFVWEQHEDFVPKEIQSVWIVRNQARIEELIEVADAFLAELDADEPGDDPDDYEELVLQYLMAKASCDKWAGVAADYADQIRARIGDRDQFAITTKLGKVSLSTPKPTERFDSVAFKKLQPSVYAEFVRVSQAKATLRITALKEETNDVL
jgi:hypothetical protein